MYDGQNTLVHPIFIKCIKYTEDIFWKSIFEDLSYGKCPYGIYIYNDHICCNYKDKKFSYKIDSSKNSEIIYNDVYTIFKNKFGLLSKSDKLQKDKLLVNSQNKLSDNLNNNWSYIKKKNIKTIFLEKYVIKNTLKYGLSKNQSKALYNNIILGLVLKTINNIDIIYENREIKEIKCIKFNKHDYKFTCDLFNFKTSILFD
tara:strand:+ start:1094 stop:1696 length:603 start_codon:yes stop_codon:yes gene_type:complete